MVKSIRSIVIVLLILTIIMGLQGAVFAANNADEVTSLLLDGDIIGDPTPANNNAADQGGLVPGNTANNEQTQQPVLNNPVNETVNKTSTGNNVPEKIVQAGENDIYVVTILIVLCGIVTVYAYKKIRDYNGL